MGYCLGFSFLNTYHTYIKKQGMAYRKQSCKWTMAVIEDVFQGSRNNLNSLIEWEKSQMEVQRKLHTRYRGYKIPQRWMMKWYQVFSKTESCKAVHHIWRQTVEWVVVINHIVENPRQSLRRAVCADISVPDVQLTLKYAGTKCCHYKIVYPLKQTSPRYTNFPNYFLTKLNFMKVLLSQFHEAGVIWWSGV